MAFPPPPAMAALGAATVAINPIETLIAGLNTNPYLIGVSMILLNLGGRHLAMGLTPEQDRFFQSPWIRRAMLFVVIFVATRNVFTALWLSVGLILVIGYLFNEQSNLYLFGPPVAAAVVTPAPVGLTAEETEIYKRLHDKSMKIKAAEELKKEGKEAQAAAAKKEDTATKQLIGWYKENMAVMRSLIA